MLGVWGQPGVAPVAHSLCRIITIVEQTRVGGKSGSATRLLGGHRSQSRQEELEESLRGLRCASCPTPRLSQGTQWSWGPHVTAPGHVETVLLDARVAKALHEESTRPGWLLGLLRLEM